MFAGAHSVWPEFSAGPNFCDHCVCENIINAEYWVLSENRKNYFSASKNQSVLIAKINSHKTQKNRQSAKINSRKNFLPHGILKKSEEENSSSPLQ